MADELRLWRKIGVQRKPVRSTTKTLHPPYLEVCLQRHTMDCAVACLSMLLGEDYETVLMAFKHNVIAKGATLAQMRKAARRLGAALRTKRKVDLEHDTGILAISGQKWKTDHAVVLKEGLIVDTDGTLWEPDVFMSAYAARPLNLYYIEED